MAIAATAWSCNKNVRSVALVFAISINYVRDVLR